MAIPNVRSGAFPLKRKYGTVKAISVSVNAKIPVIHLGRFLQLVPKSQCGIQSMIKCEPSASVPAVRGS